MTTELDLDLGEGRVLHAYDTGPADAALAVFWHHGTPNLGAPPKPLFETADRLGVRWLSYDRPGYGGSAPTPDRPIASAAAHVRRIADELGIEKFAVMGHSGGGPHALACAALLPEHVIGAVSMAGLAPFKAEGLDWFAHMATSGVASLMAAAEGREAKERRENSGVEYDPEFTPADFAALSGDWKWLNEIVGPALDNGPGPLIDDDLAYVRPWGFEPEQVAAPTLLLHGRRDRVVPCSHSEWLARHCPNTELRVTSGDGHVSILNHAKNALAWLTALPH